MDTEKKIMIFFFFYNLFHAFNRFLHVLGVRKDGLWGNASIHSGIMGKNGKKMADYFFQIKSLLWGRRLKWMVWPHFCVQDKSNELPQAKIQALKKKEKKIKSDILFLD